MSQAITDEMKYAAARAASSNTDDADARTVMLAVLGCAQAWVGDMRLIGNVRASDIVRALSAALSAGQAQPVAWRAKLDTGGYAHTSNEKIAQQWADTTAIIEPLYVSPPAVPGEVEFERLGNINRDVVEQLQAGYSWTTRIAVGEWSPQSVQLYIKSEPTASVPLPEIEGGDKGDGWQIAEDEIVDALLAKEPFVFDPATNFIHADDGGAPEHGIKYVPADLFRDLEERLANATQALEFYANPEIYKPHPHGLAFDRRDVSLSARTALDTIRRTTP